MFYLPKGDYIFCNDLFIVRAAFGCIRLQDEVSSTAAEEISDSRLDDERQHSYDSYAVEGSETFSISEATRAFATDVPQSVWAGVASIGEATAETTWLLVLPETFEEYQVRMRQLVVESARSWVAGMELNLT